MITADTVAQDKAAYDALVVETAAALTKLNADQKALAGATLPTPILPLPAKPITIALLNEAHEPAEHFPIYLRALADMVKRMKDHGWVIPEFFFSTTAVPGAAMQEQSWNFHVTDDPKTYSGNALGHHGVDAQGVPTAWISPRRCDSINRPFGVYHEPLAPVGNHPAQAARPPMSGLLTVIAHELAEAIADPYIRTFSDAPDKWLIEVADQAYGAYYIFTDPVTGTKCVMPDLTTPNYYKRGSKPPYDLSGRIANPYDLFLPAYAYRENDQGTGLVQVLAKPHP